MSLRIINKLFLFTRRIFFEEFSSKFRVELLKDLMDKLYILFERVAYNFDFLSINYLKLYDEIVEQEISMADINSKDSILVIGGGSLPATPVHISKKTKAKVLTIDKDSIAIKNATDYLMNHRLQNNIKLEYADGLNYSVKNFDVIFVLYGIKNPMILLKYLSENINNNTRVIFRATSDSIQHFEELKLKLSTLFKIKNYCESRSFRKTISYLLKKI